MIKKKFLSLNYMFRFSKVAEIIVNVLLIIIAIIFIVLAGIIGILNITIEEQLFVIVFITFFILYYVLNLRFIILSKVIMYDESHLYIRDKRYWLKIEISNVISIRKRYFHFAIIYLKENGRIRKVVFHTSLQLYPWKNKKIKEVLNYSLVERKKKNS